MKKSEIRSIISEEIKRLFDIKYAQTDNLRVWLSADKRTIYLDNISESKNKQPIENLINELKKEFGNLLVVSGDDKNIKNNQVVVIRNIDENEIDEDKLEKIFRKVSI